MPQRFYSVANLCAKRYLLNYFTKGQFPDLEIFQFSELCSRENPIPNITLPSFKLENYKTQEEKVTDLINPYINSINQSICTKVLHNQLKIDLKTMDIIMNFFSSSDKRNVHASVMLLLAKSLGEINSNQSLFAEAIELTNFGGLLHANVEENLNSSSFIHGLVGNKGMILGGDYMISNA
jgi:hypothetical protein